ncbi:MAG: hypothetical protein NC328_08715 [Muribaculum sp.]|nr:hypothetical protein [Muribaculum sp.]
MFKLLPEFSYHHIGVVALCLVIAITLSSCFTGIEGTKKIEMSRSDKKESLPTAEQSILNPVKADTLKDWLPGKKFICTDNRLALVIEKDIPDSQSFINIKDSILEFSGIRSRLLPDGSNQVVISFKLGGSTVLYPTGKDKESILNTFTARQLPMTIDLEMVKQVGNILSGMQVFTRSAMWYQGDSTRISGKKFVPVKITGVSPGISTFPLKVYFTYDSSGQTAFMYMNFGSSGYDSRSFSNLFSLSDIRQNYPRISDEVWGNICSSRVAPGMTKEECKLALGNPSDVMAGHDYSQTLDIWQYPDGAILRFADGVLVSFRK